MRGKKKVKIEKGEWTEEDIKQDKEKETCMKRERSNKTRTKCSWRKKMNGPTENEWIKIKRNNKKYKDIYSKRRGEKDKRKLTMIRKKE